MTNLIANTTALTPATGLSTALPNRNDPAKVASAAQQFEALMIGQLLKTSREAGGGTGGWLGTGDDEAGQIAMDMAEQQFARMMAANGGLGMAKMIARGLEK